MQFQGYIFLHFDFLMLSRSVKYLNFTPKKKEKRKKKIGKNETKIRKRKNEEKNWKKTFEKKSRKNRKKIEKKNETFAFDFCTLCFVLL